MAVNNVKTLYTLCIENIVRYHVIEGLCIKNIPLYIKNDIEKTKNNFFVYMEYINFEFQRNSKYLFFIDKKNKVELVVTTKDIGIFSLILRDKEDYFQDVNLIFNVNLFPPLRDINGNLLKKTFCENLIYYNLIKYLLLINVN